MELKKYQTATLATLARYLSEARLAGPIDAYTELTREPELAERLKGLIEPYVPLKELQDTPYVCLRLPTGGGKTILAAHAVTIARDNWLEDEFPLALWLVPGKVIRAQTVEALKNPRHPYRAALDEAFGGRVRVFDIGDFTQITPQDLAANCCIVVSTIQALRIADTEGRKVYAHNENLEPHFSAVPKNQTGLETISEGYNAGTIKFSFANLLHLHRPLMIVDEAHKAVTDLSQEMQRRVNPSAIIEFSATPHKKSNLLYSVSAQELKDEQMIKLPVMLAEHPSWQQAVDGAIAKRAELEDIAELDKDYIRPIVLFQAQNRDQEANVDTLKAYLIEQGIVENRIAVATGDQRELDNIDLFRPDCPVDFVITVQALKEGWDCSFAYVFCSLANIASATDAEQLLGRVLRMPYAERRKAPQLNNAYAHLASPTFSAAAMALKDRLVNMGFRDDEAVENIQPQQQTLDTGLWGQQTRPKPSVNVSVELDDDTASAIRKVAPDKIEVVASDGGTSIKVTGFLTPQQRQELEAALPAANVDAVRKSIATYETENAERVSPAEKGAQFVVPALMTRIQGELELAETDLLMEHNDWSLLDHSAKLDADEFDLRQTANTFEIDLDGRSLSVVSRDASRQLSFDVEVEGWTEQGLVLFLAKQVRQPDLSPAQLIEWLTRTVSHLTGARGLPLTGLMQCKYILARKLQDRIAAIRTKVRENVYQACLFGPEAQPEISFDHGFVFKDGIFASARKYQGDYRFSKHFTGPDNVPAFDGKPGGDEELCARALDSLPPEHLKHWVRNVSQHPDAFRLGLAKDNFYPDFVAELTDGRLLVAEYKGAHLVSSDETKAKAAIGQRWEQTSNGKCLFLMVEKTVEGRQPRDQFLEKIEGK
ncbi:DEAD/DEAH box helicase [Aurantiacibacter odishensis]|uniref:DEAD/DEAH box helicase n=1 Tax=Aurantiacibacter odishensis TaxID=1155476 RepID=UPI000E71A619|nr:DEAD/DEAH box helicase family protein [Aurantiacibacter odishensis]